MLSPASSISEINDWIKEKRYLTDGCHSVSSSSELGIVVDNALTEEQEQALIQINRIPPFGSRVLKYGIRSFVTAVPVADIELAHKYYHRLSLRRQLGYSIIGTHCMKAWIAGRLFQQLGIPSPAPVAIFENRKFQLFADTSLLSSRVAHGTMLKDFVQQHSLDSELLEKVAHNCRAIFDQFVKYRIYHSDTHPKNFLVTEEGNVSVIDLDAARIGMPLKQWQKKHKTDLLRIAKVWTVFAPETEPIFKPHFRISQYT